MSCAEVMYQFYSPYFPYKSSAEESQKFSVPSMYDSHTSSTSGHFLDSNNSSRDKEAEIEKEQPQGSQYLNPNCLLLTYFSGDIASNVDEHFSKALSQPSSYTVDRQGSKHYGRTDSTLMCQRKLPPSFWNSAYQPASTSTSHSNFPLGAETYFPTSFYGFPKNWPYYSSQAHSYGQSAHGLSYSGMDSASRLNSHYSSLMMQSPSLSGRLDTRHSQYDLGKGADAFPSSYYSMGRFGADVASTMGMESGIAGWS
ncbi:hypothetical protein SNE40_018567 [Patella caerulea]|uniref:Transcription cofactor vestigial-like protein 2 n=1 Tax=Patella caerulea TaxID=87958 RepID=A0AAN8J595_PATCE